MPGAGSDTRDMTKHSDAVLGLRFRDKQNTLQLPISQLCWCKHVAGHCASLCTHLGHRFGENNSLFNSLG